MKRLLPFLFCIMPFMAPDTGGAGGGAPAEALDLSGWIKRLSETDKKDRAGVVEELARVLGISVDDTWKKLKEAGWGSKKGKNDDPSNPMKKNSDEKTLSVSLKHKTQYSRYRRAGLVLTNQFKPYEVTEAQLAVLSKDVWIEVEEKKG